MADVRCPMCGKSNPAELEVCQYCQARLKPLNFGDKGEAEALNARGLQAQPEDSSDSQQSIDEWLSFLRDSDKESSSSASFDDSTPDWSPKDQEAEIPVEQTPPAGEESSDWLAGLRGQPDQGASQEENEPEADWLPDAESPSTEDVPDWLKEIGGESAPVDSSKFQEAAEPETAAAELAEEDQPDWLRVIRARQMEEREAGAPGQESEIESSQETWSPEEAGKGESADAEPVENESDWLAQLRSEELPEEETGDLSTSEAGVQALQPAPLAEETILEEEASLEGAEALAEPASLEHLPAESPAPSEVAQAEENIPEWMAGLVAGAGAIAVANAADSDIEGLPEWLAGLEKSSTLDREDIIPFGQEEPELTFDWLQSQIRGGEEVAAGESASSQGLNAESDAGQINPFVGDLSEFLEDAELSSVDANAGQQQLPEADIAPADLPAWLEAMRPVDAGGFDEKEAVVETSGPLAGLRGVLPAEPEFASLKKPAVYALRLQVSENQQTHATLFGELVEAEGAAKPIPGRQPVTSQYVFRLLIFFILVGLIAFPIFTASRSVPLPNVSPEAFTVSKLIDSLPNNPLVLLAVDYDPALAGEMEATSSAVVDHLMLKGAYLTLVSTSPNGPALAEHLIAEVSNRSGHVYTGIDQYANLGYIPGGSTGLAAFAQAPQQVVPYALDPDSTPVWSTQPLQGIQKLSDFSLVAVVTDDPEKARYWIEQVQPVLEATPLVMLVSAQAEPLVRPYYLAAPQQVQGMIAGLSGGGAYEQAHPNLMAGNGLARAYWDAYSYSLLAAAIMIAVGAVINLGANLATSRKQAEAEKKP
jgi:hypothetical protein